MEEKIFKLHKAIAIKTLHRLRKYLKNHLSISPDCTVVTAEDLSRENLD